MSQITYRDEWKYLLKNDYVHQTKFSEIVFSTDYISLDTDGLLTVKSGYAWDGPSGKNFIRGSLIHDALYQLIRIGYLGLSDRVYSDTLLRKICREDGMSWIRAWWVYRAVRVFGNSSANPVNAASRDVKYAP